MNVAHQSIQYTQRKKVQSKHVLAVLAAPKARRCLDSQIPIDPIGTYWNILEPDSERMSPFSAPRRWSSPMFHIPHSTSFDILRHPSTSFDILRLHTSKNTKANGTCPASAASAQDMQGASAAPGGQAPFLHLSQYCSAPILVYFNPKRQLVIIPSTFKGKHKAAQQWGSKTRHHICIH